MAAGVSPPFDAIDWSALWLVPWRGLCQPLAQQLLQDDPSVHQALQTAAPQGAPVVFVPQSALPEGTAYEQYIWDTRRVPTRDNLHDFFNGLVWLRFPHTKRRLNQLQAQAIAADGVQAVRGQLRDAITVFDENGALLQAPDALWDALRARDWQRLFIDLRPLWREARLVAGQCSAGLLCRCAGVPALAGRGGFVIPAKACVIRPRPGFAPTIAR